MGGGSFLLFCFCLISILVFIVPFTILYSYTTAGHVIESETGLPFLYRLETRFCSRDQP